MHDRSSSLVAVIVWILSGCSSISLEVAAQNNDIEKARKALAEGAFIDNGSGSYGWTPLHVAAAKGHAQITSFLLTSGANPEVREQSVGATPLYVAAQYGQVNVIDALLAGGADIDAQDKHFNTPLRVAMDKGKRDAAVLLQSYGAIDYDRSVIESGFTPLHNAAKQGSLSTAESLISNGADVNARDSAGRTPLWVAAEFNQPEIVALLISHGANVNDAPEQYWTPLYRATIRSNAKVVELLIDAGARVGARDEAGRTELHWAAQNGDEASLIALLKAGAPLDAPSNFGRTPLHFAAKAHRDRICELLISRGASLHLTDRSGVTPLYWAAISGNRSLLQSILMRYSREQLADIPTTKAACAAAYFSHPEVTEDLIRKGARPDPQCVRWGAYVAATAYQTLADEAKANSNRAEAQANYVEADRYYAIAEKEIEWRISKIDQELVPRRVGRGLGICCLVSLGAAGQAAQSYQANYQARQSAQISALKQASSNGTGLPGYYATLPKYQTAASGGAWSPGYASPTISNIPPDAVTQALETSKDDLQELLNTIHTSRQKCSSAIPTNTPDPAEKK